MGLESSVSILLICNSCVSWFDKFPRWSSGPKRCFVFVAVIPTPRKMSSNVNGRERDRRSGRGIYRYSMHFVSRLSGIVLNVGLRGLHFIRVIQYP